MKKSFYSKMTAKQYHNEVNKFIEFSQGLSDDQIIEMNKLNLPLELRNYSEALIMGYIWNLRKEMTVLQMHLRDLQPEAKVMKKSKTH
jgi:hypothetical protein